jgi:hypothetical protein
MYASIQTPAPKPIRVGALDHEPDAFVEPDRVGVVGEGEQAETGEEDVRAGEDLVDGFVILFLDVANDEVHARVSRGSRA